MADHSTTAEPVSLANDLCVGGRYVPGATWAEPGYGVLWLEDVKNSTPKLHRLAEWLEQDGIYVLQEQSAEAPDVRGQIRLSETDFVSAVRRFRESGVWQLSLELDLYGRLLGLAIHMAEARDVVPFAAPCGLHHGEILTTCEHLAHAEDDGWIGWSSHSESYASTWFPAWLSGQSRALRALYVSQASRFWQPGWVKSRQWKKAEHGRMMVDIWLCLCVDVITRDWLAPFSERTEPVHFERPSYRIPYRGEEEAALAWKRALWVNREDDKRRFAADGWLLWRLLRQAFQGIGWKTEWLSNRSGHSYYHIEMELMPPVEGGSPDWKLMFFLVHNVFRIRAPLTEWWQHDKRVWSIGRDTLIHPDIWILPELRRASEVSPVVARALQQAAPASAVIPPDEVFPFVSSELPKLIQHGFPVSMPELDKNQDLDIRVRVQVKRAKNKGTGTGQGQKMASWFNAEQLVDFNWSVVVDGVVLTRETFEDMVAKQTPLIQLGGSWKLIPLQTILQHVQQLNAGKAGSANMLQLSRSVLLADEGDDAEPIEFDFTFDDEAAAVQQVLDALKNAHQPVQIPVPKRFSGELRGYQQVGFSWLMHLRNLGLGGCLADDMGLGKTIQVLAYFLHLKEQGLTKGVHLLVCPTSLLQNWKSEFGRFTPDLRVHIHHGALRNTEVESGKTALEAGMNGADVVLTTYATLVRDVDILKNYTWDVVIADEAQNVKNASTKQSEAIRNIPANHQIALTGTPVENRLEELWSIFQFTNPGYLGNLSWFRKTFADPIARQPESAVSRRLHAILRPVLLRRKKSDPAIQLELPEKWELVEHAALTTEQAAAYQSVVNRLFVGIESRESQTEMSRRGQILAALVRLKQVCDHPCLVLGGSNDAARSGKLTMLLDMLEEVVAENECALIFTQFRDMGELICDAVEKQYGWRPKFLHGGLSAAVRGQIVEQFQAGQDPSPVLVLSLKAGGVGLNLTRANHVFHFDRWWNPAVEDQATDRAFRIGQTKDVQVHKLVCSGTLEERIDALIHSKRVLSAAVVGESEGWITEMDNTALRDLFALDLQAALEEEGE